ncbi:hypothetical protein PTTG_30803, partial [Puccinia triticina 1-1 BBBD Race 1]
MATTSLIEDNCASQSDYGNADDELSDTNVAPTPTPASEIDPDDEPVTEKHANTTMLQALTTKLDVVIKQITRSAAQRASFNRMANKMGVKVAPLIAGYGIRWNVKYESHRKALDAQEVIDALLKEDQAQEETGVFDNVHFSPRDWVWIDKLNRELEVFVTLTAQMEGNQPTGAHVIPKYLELKEQLSGKLDRAEEKDPLYPMYYAMLKRVEKYLAEAMDCETLLLATLIHPCFRIHIFELVFGAKSKEVKDCLELLNRWFLDFKQKPVCGSTLADPSEIT